MSKIEVNTVEPQCGTTLTLGGSGDTVTLGSGASQSGFGRTGTVDWDTTAKTASFTAVNGEGYFINSAGGQITVTLPSSPSAGNIVSISDYNGTAATNSIIIARNGSNINGSATNLEISKNNSAIELVYVDGTTGWQSVATGNTTDIQSSFMVATGGTVTCCGDYKIHTFTGPGTFTVCSIGGVSDNNIVSYLVVAGGASGGSSEGGGGGAGGFREYKGPADSYTASPLNGNPGGTAVTVTATSFPITVGAGGASRPCSPSQNGNPGSNSIFSTITSAGGGGGGSNASPGNALSGGSGGGSRRDANSPTAAAGNTPPVTPPQGNNGGSTPSSDWKGAGGGGGATAVGANGGTTGSGPTGESGGDGGAGATTSISGSPTAYAGGGGGSINGSSGDFGTGGTGGGGVGSSPPSSAGAGTANRGGGGGGATGKASGAGGSGIVIIRYKFQ